MTSPSTATLETKRFLRMIRSRIASPRSHALAASVAAFLSLGNGAVPGSPDQPLFHHSYDRKVIAQQIRLSLPSMERGYALMQRAGDATELSTAVGYLYDSYRYLRAAEETSENIERGSKFPDPIAAMRNQRIGQIRLNLRFCVDNRGRLSEDSVARQTCLDGLADALPKLRLVVEMTL